MNNVFKTLTEGYINHLKKKKKKNNHKYISACHNQFADKLFMNENVTNEKRVHVLIRRCARGLNEGIEHRRQGP